LPRPLIVVSNRGPVSFARDGSGRRVERRGAGGLVTALRGLLDRDDVVWIASAMSDEDREVAADPPAGVRLVVHEPRAYDLYYNTIANPFLWFLLHSLWDRAVAPELDDAFHVAWREGYEEVNRGFADAVVAELDNRPGAVVWFHDYHLFLAPRLVRDRRPDATLGHFVHTPWPTDWSALPEALRSEVHEGLLANDVVGFHTERWAASFRRSCTDVVGDCRARVVHHPISIDPGEFERLASTDAVRAVERELEQDRPEKLVVRVDRADPSKNIVRGFHAFGLFLDEHPEWQGRVRLLARLDPSRERIPEYAAYREAIDRAARALEEGHPGSVQIELADDFDRSLAAYRQYDVLFVNPVFDGLNLVAKEGPLLNERAGVLVLSENAGAHEELAPWAVTINPNDVEGQARALHEALTMDGAERRRRAEALAGWVRSHDVARWLEAALGDLEGACA
jgi:trehalose 6-phosphate synthase